MNMSLYFAEYREGIGTGEAVIAIPECPKKSKFNVKIEDDKLFCCNDDNSVSLRGNLPFKFRQNEQQKPRVSLSEGRFVCVRFPRQSITQLETVPTSTSERLSSVGDFISWSANRTNLPYSLRCSFCGHKLSKDNSMLDKVFPLPSEDFKDMAGDIFCHGHSMHIDRVISGEIVPKRDEFFLNESFVMMCSEHSSPRARACEQCKQWPYCTDGHCELFKMHVNSWEEEDTARTIRFSEHNRTSKPDHFIRME